jgi:cation transporter-like permease
LRLRSAIAVIAEKCWNITPPAAGAEGKTRMSLLIVYVMLVIAGDFVAYFIGLGIERTVPAASLPAFLAMYFLFLWVAWVIAVRITQPKAQPQ